MINCSACAFFGDDTVLPSVGENASVFEMQDGVWAYEDLHPSLQFNQV